MQEYYTIITDIGLSKEAAAHTEGNEAVLLSEMVVGDSLSVTYEPDSSMTTLKNEVFRTSLNKVYIDSEHPHQLVIEAIIPENVGPFYIREVGIFDSEGDLFALAKYPETFKPALDSGSGKDLYIRMILGFSTTPEVNLMIDPSVTLATVENVNELITQALAEYEPELEGYFYGFRLDENRNLILETGDGNFKASDYLDWFTSALNVSFNIDDNGNLIATTL